MRVKAGGGYKHHVVDWPLIVYFIRNTLQKVSARQTPLPGWASPWSPTALSMMSLLRQAKIY